MEYDVFISYSNKDIEIFERIKRIAVGKGYSCISAETGLNLGSSFMEEIEKAIRSAKFFIVVITEQSKNSHSVMNELGYALRIARDRGKIIIPIVDEYENIPIQIRHIQVGKIDNLDEVLDQVFTNDLNFKKLQNATEKITELFKLRANYEACELIKTIIDDILNKGIMFDVDKQKYHILKNILLKFGYDVVKAMIKEVSISYIKAVDYLLENGNIFDEEPNLMFQEAGDLTLYATDMIVDLEYPYTHSMSKYNEIRNKLREHFPDFQYKGLEKLEKERYEKEEENSDKELYEAAARYLNESYNMFNLLMERGAGYEFAKCLLTSYERLKSYCELVGDTENGSLCISKIFQLKANIKKMESEYKNDTFDNIAEKGLKLLLGLKIPDSGKYDVFLCHKKEDLDIAESVYDYLRGELKEVFLDSKSLPQLGKSEYEEAIMQALDNSDHFIVILSDLSYLDSDWVKTETKIFHSEIMEGRKRESNFLFLVTENVMKKIKETNKTCLHVRFRKYEIMMVSEFATKLKDYIK